MKGRAVKVVINRCYGGFRLSEKAYEKLIEYGVPVRQYTREKRDPKTGRCIPEPTNDGEIIFDRNLDDVSDEVSRVMKRNDRYWDTWTRDNRAHPLLVRVVEELGSNRASSRFAELKVVEIPDDIEWEIEEYDGVEWVSEKHRMWP